MDPAMNRRSLLKLGAALTATLALSTSGSLAQQRACALRGLNSDNGSYPFELPDLGYDAAALEPYIDADTMTNPMRAMS